MALDYKTVKACADARKLLEEYDIYPHRENLRTYKVGRLTYSQQEVHIPQLLNNWAHNQYDHRVLELIFPEGVRHHCFRSPNKEYISFKDANGTDRYYVVPPEGLRIHQVGHFYQVRNPVNDYHIEVDRVKAREARKPAEDLYNYVDTLWDMVPSLYWADQACPKRRIKEVPEIGDTQGWYDYVNAAKNATYDRIQKSTALAELRKKFTGEALAFNISVVPNNRMDHTAHWGRIDELRAAGRLEQFEGKVKKKRKRNGQH